MNSPQYGAEYGWMGIVVLIVTMLLVSGVLITLGVFALRRFGHGGNPSAGSQVSTESERILDARFARGEIDEQEYQHRRELLRSRN
jgi:putative membrane protein